MYTRRVRISVTNKTYRRLRNAVSTWAEPQARSPAAWAARICCQVGDAHQGAGVSPAAARIRRIVPAPVRYPRPGAHPGCGGAALRVLPGQPPHQLTDLLRDRRASGRVRIGPRVLEDAPVPGEQGARCHDPVQPKVPGAAALPRRRPRRGQPSPVAGGRPGGAAPRPRAAAPRSRRLWRRRQADNRTRSR
jgi:hypothetical protein